MRKYWIASTALLVAALGGASAAIAGGASAPGPTWTGFYVGAEGGLQIMNSNWGATCFAASGGACTLPPTAPTKQTLDGSGPELGGVFGYNWQVSQWGLVGVEGDLDWAYAKASLSGGFPGLPGNDTSVNDKGFVNSGWGGSLRVRAGFLATPSVLVYATGGLAFQQFGFNASCPTEGGSWCDSAHDETVSSTRTGYTVGLGLEKSFGASSASEGGPWRVRLEYRYSDFGRLNREFFANTTDVIGASFPLNTQTIEAGLSYGF